ncbi:MAG: helix-turn-helix domain-containing protein [Chloroflexaceae bacterium]|nr:helix-turn-helix domain-containing protein [Chloroflexaceae bacterium]
MTLAQPHERRTPQVELPAARAGREENPMSEERKQPPAKQRRRTRHEWDARRIRALREYMGMTQQQMADELEVRQQTISEWETGVHRPHRSTQKTLSMVAERAGFVYQAENEEESESSNENTTSADGAAPVGA